MLSAMDHHHHSGVPPPLPPKRRPGRPPVYVFTKPDAELSENERRLKGAVLKRRMRQNRSYHRKKRLRQLQAHDDPPTSTATGPPATLSSATAAAFRNTAPLLSSPNPPRLSNLPLTTGSSPLHHNHYPSSSYSSPPQDQQNHFSIPSLSLPALQPPNHNHNHTSLLRAPSHTHPHPHPHPHPHSYPHPHSLSHPQHQRPALSSFSLSPSVPRLGGVGGAGAGAGSSSPAAVAPPPSSAPPAPASASVPAPSQPAPSASNHNQASASAVALNGVSGNQAIAAVLAATSSAPTRIQDPLSPTSFVSPTASTASPKPGDESRALQQLLDLSGPTSGQMSSTAARHSLLNQSQQQNHSLHMQPSQQQSPHSAQPQLHTMQPQVQSPPVNSQPLTHSPHHHIQQQHHHQQQHQHQQQVQGGSHSPHNQTGDQTQMHHPLHHPIQPIHSPHHQQLQHHQQQHQQQQQQHHHQNQQHQQQQSHQPHHQQHHPNSLPHHIHPLSSPPSSVAPPTSLDVHPDTLPLSPRIAGLSHSVTAEVPGLLLFPASFTADAAAAICQAASTTVGVGGFIDALLNSGVVRQDHVIGRFTMNSHAKAMFSTAGMAGVKWRRRFVDFFTHKLRKCANGRLLSGTASQRASALHFYHVEERNIRTAVGFARGRDVGPNRFMRLMSAVSPSMRVFVPVRDRIELFTSALDEMEKARNNSSSSALGRRLRGGGGGRGGGGNRNGSNNGLFGRAIMNNHHHNLHHVVTGGKEELTTTTTTTTTNNTTTTTNTATTATTTASSSRLAVGDHEDGGVTGMNAGLQPDDVDANASGTVVGVDEHDVDDDDDDSIDVDEDEDSDADGDTSQSLAEADGRVRLAVAEAYFDSLRVREGSAHLSGAINSLTACGDSGAARSMSSMIALMLLAEVRLGDGLGDEACQLLAQAMNALREVGLHKSTVFASCLLSLASAYTWNGAAGTGVDWEKKAEQTVRNALDMLTDLGLNGGGARTNGYGGTCTTSSTTSTHESSGRTGRKDKGGHAQDQQQQQARRCAVYADGLRTLAAIRLRAGQVKEAEQLLFSALDIVDVKGGAGMGVDMGMDVGVGVGYDGVEGLRVVVLETVAECYAVQNQHDEARQVVERARQLRREGGMGMDGDGQDGDSRRARMTRHVY